MQPLSAQRRTVQQAGLAFEEKNQTPVGEGLRITLDVRDPETVAALCEQPEGAARERFAEQALRIGVLALRQAAGRIDADAVRRESEIMLGDLRQRLDEHARVVHDKLTGSLRDYFDPENGSLHQRIGALLKRDGELEQLLRRQIAGEDSALAKTLTHHVGDNSPLFKMLSPGESEGVLAALRATLDEELTKQREKVLGEFSLDNKESALGRLVEQIAGSQGKLHEALEKKIDEVVREFSLDEENSALSRLVHQVDRAQRTISSEFSLDNEASAFSRMAKMLEEARGAIRSNLTLDDDASPLARLRKELLELVEKQSTASRDFQEEVKVSLGKLTARREEAEKGTRHGLDYEHALHEFLLQQATKQGDLLEHTGGAPGLKGRKVGDFVWSLGPESMGAGGKIVIEAKEDRSYDLGKAQAELADARSNRGAHVGVFVFSQRTAPAGLTEEFCRIGCDYFVVWDAENGETDVYLRAACMAAKATCVQSGKAASEISEDLQAMTQAVAEIEKHAELLSEISKSSESIRRANEKIDDRVRKTRAALERQVERLRERLQSGVSALVE